MTADRVPDRDAPLTDHDRARLRATWRTAAVGPLLGIVGAIAVGIAGGSGAAGLAVLLLLASVGAMAAAMLTAVHVLADEYRHRPVARRRVWTSLALFATAFVLVAMSGGAATAV